MPDLAHPAYAAQEEKSRTLDVWIPYRGGGHTAVLEMQQTSSWLRSCVEEAQSCCLVLMWITRRLCLP